MTASAPNRPPIAWPILGAQVGILAACLAVVVLLFARFPFPSPLVAWALPPKLRWPTDQVKEWIAAGQVDEGFFAFFMRDPDRVVPPGKGIVAPADGLFADLVKHDGKQYVVICLSFWDVHMQRSPVAGVVTAVRDSGDTYMDGEWRDGNFLKDKVGPVQKIVTIDSEIGPVDVHLITSVSARRLEVFPKVGERIEKGQRLGRILLGSTVVLQLPDHLAIKVEKGVRVVAGETVLAEMEVH